MGDATALGYIEKAYLQLIPNMLSSPLPGDVAQLGERDNRTVEARGSSPLISTATILHFTTLQIAKVCGIVRRVPIYRARGRFTVPVSIQQAVNRSSTSTLCRE